MPRLCLLLIIGMLSGFALRAIVPCHWWFGMMIVMLLAALIDRHAKTVTLLLYSSMLCCGAFILPFEVERMCDEVGERSDNVNVASLSRLAAARKSNVKGTASFQEQFKDARQSLQTYYFRAEIHDDERAVLSAITLGDKSFISKDLKEVYSRTGASHILALSGMHLAIIFAIVMYVLFYVLLGVDRLLYNCIIRQKVCSLTNLLLEYRPEPYLFQNIATVICCVFIWNYVLLVGAMPSVVRAATMLSLYSVLRLFNRQARGLNILCITAFVMLLFSPLSLFDVGFQMSFLAVLGITLFFSRVSGIYKIEIYEKGIRRWLKWLWDGISLALTAQLFVLPLVAFYFGRIAVFSILLSPFISLLAVILVGCSIGFLFLNVLAECVFIPAFIISFAASALSFMAKCQNAILQWIASLPFSYVDDIQFSLPQLVIVYVIIVSILLIMRIITKK